MLPAGFHSGTAVCQACDDAEQYGLLDALAQRKCHLHHVVALLLVAGFEDGDEGEFSVETAVLFVLAAVH